MTPAARVQAAIELLDHVATAAREGGAAADTLIQRYFAQRRYAGSKDRRAVRDLVYEVIRAVAEVPSSGRSAMLALAADRPDLAGLFDGSPHGPAAIVANEPVADRGVVPAWLRERLDASAIGPHDQAALLERAPLDLRVNSLLVARDTLAAEIEGAEAIAGLPEGLRVPAGLNVATLSGRAEVQDAGSQVVAMAAEARPGQRVVDLCAGAGGKTLALAADMRNAGSILATDTDRARLARLGPRAAAAGVTVVEPRLLDPGRESERLSDWRETADIVLIDAPCSGTGTWRRNPEARWRLTPGRLDRFVATQRHVLDVGATLVRPGGALVYIVCSLLDEEGAAQIDAFIGRGGWIADHPLLPRGTPRGAGTRLTPARDDTDGFFVARLIRTC